MAKAKRERRTSIRTLPADGGLDFLDKLDEIDRQQKAQQGVEEPSGGSEAGAPGDGAEDAAKEA